MTRSSWLGAVLGVSLVMAAVHAYANPGACSGTCTNTHDPSIIRRSSDGTYFRFSTGGGIAIHTAPAITGPWTYKGAVLPSGTKVTLPSYTGTMDVWAPDVRLVGSTYYLYYSAVRAVAFDGHNLARIGYATSTTMNVGSWTDHGAVGISSDDTSAYNAIDSSLFVENNLYYMIFGSWESGIYQVAMASPPTKPSSSSIKLAYDPNDGNPTEGANLYKYGSYNYLFFSHGICCGLDASRPASGKEYMIKVCRSSPGVVDFRDSSGVSCTSGGGTIVLKSHDSVYAPGGQGVYDDPINGPVLYYHYVNTNIGYADGQKQFGWNKLDFSSGWPVAK